MYIMENNRNEQVICPRRIRLFPCKLQTGGNDQQCASKDNTDDLQELRKQSLCGPLPHYPRFIIRFAISYQMWAADQNKLQT